MNEEYNSFIPDHPFIHVTEQTLYETLRRLINDRERILQYQQISKNWVDKTHNIKIVADNLYKYYQKLGLPC